MHGAGQTRIEAVHGAQDLERLFRIRNMDPLQRRLIGAGDTRGVARSRVPGRRHDRLIIGDQPLVDDDPVRQGTARRFQTTDALGVRGPAGALPLCFVERAYVARLDVRLQLCLPRGKRIGQDLAFERAREIATHHRIQRLEGQSQSAKRLIGDRDRRCVTRRIHHEHAREGSHFHRMALPPRRFDP